MRGDRIRRPLDRREGHEVLRRLQHVDLNFDLGGGGFTEATGWKVDDYCIDLPPESPGAPLETGSWQVARRLLEHYEFADPAIVRAVYDPDSPLDGRTMVLEGRFYFMRFVLGVRVGGLIDRNETLDGRPARRWGWSYRTLEGHLEKGQMDYEVRKWTDTGEVEFRIHAFSKAAHIPNPVVRLGFAVFGRHMQKRFARQALARMRRLVQAELISQSTGADTREPVEAADRLEVAEPPFDERGEAEGD